MFRTIANTIEGERACTASEPFWRGCVTMRRTPVEMSSSEKIYEIPSQRRRLTARAFPTRESQLKERFSASFGAPGARQGQVSFDARPGRSISSYTNTKCSSSTAMSLATGCTVWRNGTMGQLYHSAAFFSFPIAMYFKPESPVSFAPCTTCGRRGASKEKKVWVHGLMQRAPRLVGRSREKLESKTYSIFSFCFPRDQ